MFLPEHLLTVEVGVSRIPKETAAKLVNYTIPIPGDPGYYIISLNVFHQLHCLVNIYNPSSSFSLFIS